MSRVAATKFIVNTDRGGLSVSEDCTIERTRWTVGSFLLVIDSETLLEMLTIVKSGADDAESAS